MCLLLKRIYLFLIISNESDTLSYPQILPPTQQRRDYSRHLSRVGHEVGETQKSLRDTLVYFLELHPLPDLKLLNHIEEDLGDSDQGQTEKHSHKKKRLGMVT